jgi:hypothetical protein
MATRRRGAARGPGKRVVINREAVEAIRLGAADGLHAVGVATIERARPNVPDAPPLGQGLTGGGMVVTVVDRRKVAGYGPTAKLPRSDPGPKSGIVTYLGYTFPSRFNELGTTHQPARPFFTPALAAESPSAGTVVAPAIAKRLAKVRT